jgi:membrane associated rhomboid family serine protease
MGIYDREYVRQGGPSFLESITDRGKICKYLIGINVLVFIVQLVTVEWRPGYGPFTSAFWLDVRAVWQGEVWRLLTYGFLHTPGSPFHILFNMLLLWWLGRDIEEIYGPREFLTIYLVTVVLGGVAFTLTHPGGGYCLGASGAVMMVMVLAALHFPNRIMLVMFVLPAPIWLLALLYVGIDAFYFLTRVDNGVAVGVHLAGAAFAYLYYKMEWHLSGWMKGWSFRNLFRSRPKLKIYKEQPERPASRPVPAEVDADEQIKAEMDVVLARMSEVGKENLTEEELQILQRASEVLRKRQSHSPR